MSKDNFPDKSINELVQAILLLETEEECLNFLTDLCTITELKSMAQRLTVAKRLQEGHTYWEITEETGVSTATISRVSRALEYGENGYGKILDRIRSLSDQSDADNK